jgi:hypothetical protein
MTSVPCGQGPRMSVSKTKCISLMALLCQGLEVFAHAKRGWQCQPLLFA